MLKRRVLYSFGSLGGLVYWLPPNSACVPVETSNLVILATGQPVIARMTCREYANTRKQNLSFAVMSKRRMPLLMQTPYA